MKVRIGYTNKYIEIEDLSQLKNNLNAVLEDLKEENLVCSYCKEKIKGNDWNMIVHNPKEPDIPVRIHFFHFSKQCGKKWAEVGIKDRTKLVSGDF